MFADFGAMRVTGDEATASTRSAGGLPSTHTRQGMRALYDGDGDGQVQRAEFDAGRKRAFVRTDRNGDGRLDPEEYLSDYRQRLDRGLASERAAALQQLKVRFEALDRDRDAAMTWQEYAASGQRLFERADRGRDGRVVSRCGAGSGAGRLPAPATAGARAAGTADAAPAVTAAMHYCRARARRKHFPHP